MIRLYFLIIYLLASGTSIAANSKYLYQVDGDTVLGSSDAIVTIIDYSSFSCPTCAHFHNDVLPELEERYINTGKAKLIFRNYPLRPVDLKAAVIPICAGKDKYYTFIKVLFKTQQNWAHESSHSIETLEHIARLGGMFGDELQKCFDDKSLEDEIVKTRYIAQNELGVNATPTLIINGITYKGSMNKKKLFEIIESSSKSQ